MTVYRVRYQDKAGRCKGYDYFGGAVVARAAVIRATKRGEQAEVQPFDVPLTREGVLNALQQFGCHPERS
jgi:hypothetical protein